MRAAHRFTCGAGSAFRLLLIILVLTLSTAVNAEAASQLSASIILLDTDGHAPSPFKVQMLLQDELKEIGVNVKIQKTDEFPATPGQWKRLSKKRKISAPGVVAVFGWSCSDKQCILHLLETASLSKVEIPVDFKEGDVLKKTDDESPEDSVLQERYIAGTVKDVVFGPLLFELARLNKSTGGLYSADTGKPVSYSRRLKTEVPPAQPSLKKFTGLRLNAEYSGGYPHPSSGTVHGLMLGGAYYFNPYIAPSVELGWTGIRRGRGITGSSEVNLFPLMLSLRISFPMGEGMFSVAPAVKIDFLLIHQKPSTSSDFYTFDVDFSFGGLFLWHLPTAVEWMDFMAGTGLFATLASSDLNLSGETVLHATTFQFMWFAGLSFDIHQR